MIQLALVCAGLLIGQTASAPSRSRDLKGYEALKIKAGSSPEGQVKLALWCEAQGLSAEKVKHLARAVLADPKNALARGLLGLIEVNGRWQTPVEAAERIQADRDLSGILPEYQDRQAQLTAEDIRSQQSRFRSGNEPETSAACAARIKSDRQLAKAHADLAFWCKSNGLKSEATAHFTMAVHLDPDRDSSWRRLGYIKRNGRWISQARADFADKEERDQRQADRHWEPLLKKWKFWLGDGRTRVKAEDMLATVTDRRALPSLLKTFPADASQAAQLRRVRLIGQIDDPSSSRILASQAIDTPFEPVRASAIQILKSRPPRDYAFELVQMIRGTIQYQVQPVNGPNSRGALAIDAPRFRMLRTYEVPHAFELHESFRGYVGYDDNGMPIVVSGRELERMRIFSGNPVATAATVRELELRTANMLAMATETARSRMAADIETIESINQQARENNARVAPILEAAAGAPGRLGNDEDAWHVWWYDTLGYKYEPAPKLTFAEDVSPQYQAPYIRTCFAAGTAVQTMSGARPIESIQVGDLLLSQDPASGSLSFQPVLYVHRNPPDQTLRIRLSDGDSVVCSIYHRFWQANRGWAQARELKPGDTLRHVGGTIRIDQIEADTIQPLYNLDVSTSRTFFVGQSELLVHDNTLPDHRLPPFDSLPALVSSAAKASN